jgi:hypothetical protein
VTCGLRQEGVQTWKTSRHRLGLRQARYRLGSVEEIGGKIIMACVERRLDYWRRRMGVASCVPRCIANTRVSSTGR